MNKKMITYVLGILLITESILLLLPTFIGLYYKENVVPFLISIAAAAACGFIMTRFKPNDKTILSSDGFAIVSLGWILISLFGALPFFISKEIPNYLDAVFEVVSGFTTTGSSILTNVEALSKEMIFWRMVWRHSLSWHGTSTSMWCGPGRRPRCKGRRKSSAHESGKPRTRC